MAKKRTKIPRQPISELDEEEYWGEKGESIVPVKPIRKITLGDLAELLLQTKDANALKTAYRLKSIQTLSDECLLLQDRFHNFFEHFIYRTYPEEYVKIGIIDYEIWFEGEDHADLDIFYATFNNLLKDIVGVAKRLEEKDKALEQKVPLSQSVKKLVNTRQEQIAKMMQDHAIELDTQLMLKEIEAMTDGRTTELSHFKFQRKSENIITSLNKMLRELAKDVERDRLSLFLKSELHIELFVSDQFTDIVERLREFTHHNRRYRKPRRTSTEYAMEFSQMLNKADHLGLITESLFEESYAKLVLRHPLRMNHYNILKKVITSFDDALHIDDAMLKMRPAIFLDNYKKIEWCLSSLSADLRVIGEKMLTNPDTSKEKLDMNKFLEVMNTFAEESNGEDISD